VRWWSIHTAFLAATALPGAYKCRHILRDPQSGIAKAPQPQPRPFDATAWNVHHVSLRPAADTAIPCPA
jgi:hypothetical protein